MKHWFCTIHRTPRRDTVTDEYALGVLREHTAYFKQLGREGKCLMAGPFVQQPAGEDLGAGCYVFAAEDEATAHEWAAADPLAVEGLYSFKIWEWTKVVPE
jgi:uncharacterized protein YciI